MQEVGLFQARDIMELPPNDLNNNPHLRANNEQWLSGFQPIMADILDILDREADERHRQAITARENRKSAKIQSLAVLHARRTRSPEPEGKVPETWLGNPQRPVWPLGFDDIPGGDRRRDWETRGAGPYYGNRPSTYFALDPARYDLSGRPGHIAADGGPVTITRPSSADLFKDQL